MLSLADSQTFEQTLPPAVRTASANGSAVQSGGDAYARSALINSGLWTNGTHKFTFEKSEDGSAWTEMTADELNDKDGVLDSVDLNSVNIVDATNDNTIHQLDLLTTDEFVRAVQTVSGASGEGLLAGVTIQNGHPLRATGGRANPGQADGVLHEGAIVF